MNNKNIFQSNRRSTKRMRQIIHSLSEKELSQTIGNNWTISITLAHLAFWDQRVIHVIELAKKNTVLNAPLFDDQLNDILTPILGAISPPEAVRMAINIADELDEMLEECSPEFIEQLLKKNNRLVERSLHRNNHLDEIESMVKSSKNQ
jgi:hypothetical protein